MTVGIAAICQEDSNERIVLAADRMISTGMNPRIEYEHTKSKIQTVYDNDVVNCMGVASGTVAYIEDFFNRLSKKLDGHEASSVQDVARKARRAYVELGQETAENSVLDQFDLELSDLSDLDADNDSELVASLLSDVSEKQNEFASQLEVVLGGIDAMGPHVFAIEQFDLNPQNTIGYHAIGSGNQPARSVFIRNSYDTNACVREGILNVIEAKSRSEQARGVGSKMDLAVIRPPSEGNNCCHVFDDDRKDDWVGVYEDIVEAEQKARQETISDSDVEYSHGDQP